MKLNHERLKTILDDLYAIDGNLRQYEKELEKIIQEIVEFRPQVILDEQFLTQLRGRLMVRAEELKARREQKVFGWHKIFNGRPTSVLAGVLILVIIVLVGSWFVKNKQGISLTPKSAQEAAGIKKVVLSDNAFGELSAQSRTQTTAPDGRSGVSSNASGLGGGGGGVTSVLPAAPSNETSPNILQPYFFYKYVYKGEPLELKDSTVEVLRRVGFNQDVSGLGSLLNAIGMGLIDFSGFDSLKFQNINLVEDKDSGYLISADLQGGIISISQNWDKWPQAQVSCPSGACPNSPTLKISDVPPDEQILAIAQSFLAQHKIDLSAYGGPEVVNDWRVEYEKNPDKSQFYIPDSISVLYPLKINGDYVYDESGNKTGLSVSVDIREKIVSGVGNITSQSYESSNYAAETDAARILQIAQQGGGWGFSPMIPAQENGTTLEIGLGTPQRANVFMTNYNNGQTQYLFVPSLIFPVIETPSNANYYYPKSVVVPLAKELLDVREVQPPQPMMKQSN